jgi:hypothetical protein
LVFSVPQVVAYGLLYPRIRQLALARRLARDQLENAVAFVSADDGRYLTRLKEHGEFSQVHVRFAQ